MNIYQSKSNKYQLEIPTGWNVKENNNIASLFNPLLGNGSMEISSYQVPDEYFVDCKKELAEFVKNTLEAITEGEIIGEITQSSRFYLFETEAQGTFWRFWLFFKKPNIIFATYNCQLTDKGVEAESVDKIINSISLF